MSKIVVALGGNALQRANEASAADQEKVAKQTVQELIPLIKAGHELVIVHGNGPQVGNIVLHEEAIDTDSTPTMPLHTCVAMTQGMIGFWLQKAFIEEFRAENLKKSAVSVVTQIEVDANDSAFSNPTKPIGPFYSEEEEARRAEQEKGYTIKEDSGRGWRRVVPSPKPINIVEKDTVADLLSVGSVVIAAGGGGIAVKNQDGRLTGIDAVIDKDFAAELLAREIGADILLILTAVDNAMINYGKENQQALEKITPEQAEEYIAQGQFGAGSMLPKIEASLNFAKSGGKAIITSLENARDAIAKDLGTIIIK